MYLFKNTNGQWVFGESIYDVKSAKMNLTYKGGSQFLIYQLPIFYDKHANVNGLLIDILTLKKDIAGDFYTSVDDFLNSTVDFFVDASNGGGLIIPNEQRVLNYSALPNPTTVVPYELYGVQNSQGSVITFNYKEAGIYYSTGTSWIYSGFPIMEVEPAITKSTGALS